MKINQRLFDHYGIDTTKDLQISHRCARPFDTILIDKQGSCFACECTAWLPQSIGNLQVRHLADIIDSDMHKMLQAGILDGSYRYCNQAQCSYLRSGQFYEQTETQIRHIRLAIDESCNLKCPSCRTQMIFHKTGTQYNLGIRLADRVNDWLREYPHPVQVHIGSDGDPFASHVYRHFMTHTPDIDTVTYSILTNGLMLRDFHGTVPHVISKLSTLGISIDGATRHTYEKLRMGGRWDKVVDALDCATELKQTYGFRLNMHMVVQQDNWHEMELMCALAHKHNVDTVYFNIIEDWNTNIDMSAQTFQQDDTFKRMAKRVAQYPHTWMNIPH